MGDRKDIPAVLAVSPRLTRTIELGFEALQNGTWEPLQGIRKMLRNHLKTLPVGHEERECIIELLADLRDDPTTQKEALQAWAQLQASGKVTVSRFMEYLGEQIELDNCDPVQTE